MAPAVGAPRLLPPVALALAFAASVIGGAAAATMRTSAIMAALTEHSRRPLLLEQRRRSAELAAAKEASSRGAALLLSSSATASAGSLSHAAAGGGASSVGGAVAARNKASADAAAGERGRKPSAGFFEGFSEGESTYDEAADNGRQSHQAGWEPSVKKPKTVGGLSSAWFHESASGGAAVAWQTHYPALQNGLAAKGATFGAWEQGPGGGWTQQYVEAENNDVSLDEGSPFAIRKLDQEIPAAWFDESVAQYDSFGRRQAPSAASARFFASQGWKEISVNTTLACTSPGCVATSALQAFDGETHRGRRCRLNVDAEHYSGDSIQWISVNGVNVSFDCREPGAAACGDGDAEGARSRSLYPCVLDLNLDKLMPSTGLLDISAKIPDTAPESCKYQGRLLSMVPMVSCLVQKLPKLLAETDEEEDSEPDDEDNETLDEP